MPHDKSTLERFQDGETRLIYGREPGGSLWLLPDGQAKKHRPWVKASVICPVDNCPTPSLTTVGRAPKKRDGFKHLTPHAGGHSPESLFHVQGKQRVADWLRAKYPNSTVNLEEQSDTKRTRIADVMITSPDGTVRVAFEIQYAALTPAAWRERHESYRAQGIVDVWLWGHYGKQLRAVPRFGENLVELNPTQQELVKEGMPLLWINPIEGTIGTATRKVIVDGRAFPAFATERGEFEAFPLEECRADKTGMSSDRIRDIIAGQVNAAAAQAAYEARLAKEEAERKERLARAAATAKAQLERERQQRVKRLAADEASWAGSRQRELWIRINFGGTVPEFIGVPVKSEIWMPTEHWQMLVHAEFVGAHRKRRPDGFTPGMAVKRLMDATRGRVGTSEPVTAAVAEWLDRLVELGLLTTKTVRSTYRWTTRVQRRFYIPEDMPKLRPAPAYRPATAPVYVTPPVPTPPPRDPDAKPEWAKKLSQNPVVTRLPAPAPTPESSLLSPDLPPMTHDEMVAGAYLYCRKCGKTVTVDGRKAGYHAACSPPAAFAPRPDVTYREGSGSLCRKCGRPVDSLLPSGYHLMCDPARLP